MKHDHKIPLWFWFADFSAFFPEDLHLFTPDSSPQDLINYFHWFADIFPKWLHFMHLCRWKFDVVITYEELYEQTLSNDLYCTKTQMIKSGPRRTCPFHVPFICMCSSLFSTRVTFLCSFAHELVELKPNTAICCEFCRSQTPTHS